MRLLCKIQYDGSDYHGFQRQSKLLTVQGEIEAALKRIYQKQIDIHSTSRTDAGVHALSQYFHFDVDPYIEIAKLRRILNEQLPESIDIAELQEVEPSFHARYDCKRKTYRYDVITSKEKQVFMSKYALIYKKTLRYEVLEEGLRLFFGKKDYGALQASGAEKGSTVRDIQAIRIEKKAEGFSLYITADGFLYHMVRIIVGALLDLNEGRRTMEELEEGLKNKDREAFRRTAPASGLYLIEVEYESL